MSAAESERTTSLQERYAPESICFGCGPVNAKGLRIRTMTVSADSDEVVLDWTPEPHHQAFEGIVNGGILASLLDCHSNWAAAWHLKRRDGLEGTPVTVTADFHVTLTRPTPADRPMRINARATESDGSWVTVEAEVLSDGKVTARCTGRFVAVKPGHPAYEASPHAAKGTLRPAIGD